MNRINRLLILVAVLIILLVIAFGPRLLSQMNREKNDRNDVVMQQLSIFITAENTGSEKVSKYAKASLDDFDKKLRELCRKQYVIKEDCTTDELSVEHMKILQKKLEQNLDQLNDLQQSQ